ncbi:MAG TPA: hypothetical protein VFC02_20035 [Anaerolineales bacterium]|jgi:F0F1-type ATP synthase assembly protein I|nr:hypothetical protein [Anaerolineales bacterium]
MSENTSTRVELDELLASEYDYITHTANQANEDRARVSSFYLIAVGSLVAALFGTQLFDEEKFTQAVKIMFSGLFVLLTLMGTSTIMQLARLRGAWYEAMLAMNQIKDFAMQQSPELTKAFRWTTNTLPPKYKKRSVSYFQAVEVSLISGLMFGAAMFFLQQAFFSISWITWMISALLGLCAVYLQLIIYRKILD